MKLAASPIKPESIVVVYKRSRFERDRERYACSAGELTQVYRNWGLTPERIRESDKRQRAARTKLAQLLPGAKFIPGEGVTRATVAKADLVVALGGDNHFQRVARLLGDQLILGINSDPQTSAGALTPFTVATFDRALPALSAGRLPLEKWTRLDVSLNGKRLPEAALGEVFIGESTRCVMSRHILYFGCDAEDQKSSGLLIVTGAGSTGWFASAVPSARTSRVSFSPTAPTLCFTVTEPHPSVIRRGGICATKGSGPQSLRVISLNRHHGVVCLDAFQSHPVAIGTVIEITLGHSLNVVRRRRLASKPAKARLATAGGFH